MVQTVILALPYASTRMQQDAGNINILHVRSLQRKHATETQQIAVACGADVGHASALSETLLCSNKPINAKMNRKHRDFFFGPMRMQFPLCGIDGTLS